MTQANHRCEVERLLEEWSQNPRQHKNIINCLVEFLCGDLHWLDENASIADKDAIAAAAVRLLPNARISEAMSASENPTITYAEWVHATRAWLSPLADLVKFCEESKCSCGGENEMPVRK